jgi:hypothetical protein
MPVLGGSPRQLIRDIDSPIDFSPDGKQFVFQRGIPERDAIEVRIAQLDGSGERLLAALPGNSRFLFGATWSPDGKTVAVPILKSGKDVDWQMHVINVADGKCGPWFHLAGKLSEGRWDARRRLAIASGEEACLAEASCKASIIPVAKCTASPMICRTIPPAWT